MVPRVICLVPFGAGLFLCQSMQEKLPVAGSLAYPKAYADIKICEERKKMMKEKLTESGFAESATGSPRTILKTAYKAGMIVDEQSWLDALQARNNVAHAYNEAVALDIIHQTKESFYDLFGKLKNEIEENWL